MPPQDARATIMHHLSGRRVDMEQPKYLRNQWYVAGRSDELGDKPLGRTLLNEPIVLFRRKEIGRASCRERV